MVSIIVKTSKGLEKIVASRILELFSSANVIARPSNYAGIVFVDNIDESKAYDVMKNIPEVEKALPVFAEVKADPEEIANVALRVAKKMLVDGESFAVRTTRRGKHGFTSIDVNVVVGAKIKENLGNPVNLDYPDKVVWVEIFGDRAFISITKELAMKKPKPDKTLAILRKISIIQMPYLGDLEGAYRMGVRIGRAAQAFEVGELVIAPHEIIDAEEFESFLKGVLEGRRSRYEIQRKSYARNVKLVPVKIYDIYQLARSRLGETFITTSAKGRRITYEICEEIVKVFRSEKRVNIFIGSREGIPTGIARWSKYTINLCPGITFATEHGIPAVISAIITCHQIIKETKNTSEGD